MDKELQATKVYHFVSKEEMLNKINEFSINLNLDRSKSIRLIIDTMMPLVDNYIIFEQESGEFGYNEFGAEVDIRFYIDPNIYRKLRNVHGTMHSFSIAVLIRKMIELFFFFIEAKSFTWLINTMNSSMKKILRIFYKTGRLLKNTENIVHMFGEEQVEEHISLIFSNNYTLLGVIKAKKQLFYKH